MDSVQKNVTNEETMSILQRCMLYIRTQLYRISGNYNYRYEFSLYDCVFVCLYYADHAAVFDSG